MSEKQRLLAYLRERDGKTLLNIKFSVDGKEGLTEEALCAEVNEYMFAKDQGLVCAMGSFPESQKQIDVTKLGK